MAEEEGRLVWDINDFGEAATLPCVCNLVRLAISVRLAPDFPGSNKARAEVIVDGYRRGLEAPGPFFIDDKVPWMKALANRPATKIDAFRFELNEAVVVAPPPQISNLLKEQLPAGTLEIVFRT